MGQRVKIGQAFGLLLLLSSTALAEDRWYGFHAGGAAFLDPTEWGATASLSAALAGDQAAGVRVRGELWGMAGRNGWAALPLLTGEGAIRLGPLEPYLLGGVQLFGFAKRGDWTTFATFGLVGGGGLAVRLADDLKLTLRAQLIWLPDQTTAQIEAKEDASKPRFLLWSTSLGIELRREFTD